jgi:hypothetical protein
MLFFYTKIVLQKHLLVSPSYTIKRQILLEIGINRKIYLPIVSYIVKDLHLFTNSRPYF